MTPEKIQIQALVTDWSKIPIEHPHEGIERQMVVGENMMICRFKFVPNLVTPAHEHPHEQMTLVVQGKAKFIVGDEEKIVSAGDVLHFPPNTWHGATMLDEEVVLIDIFSPIREDFLK
jgi:quercetin dioxygenase-like cupin family protein